MGKEGACAFMTAIDAKAALDWKFTGESFFHQVPPFLSKHIKGLLFWGAPKNYIHLLFIEKKNEECTNPSLKTLGFASLGNAVGHFNNICATGNEFVFNK